MPGASTWIGISGSEGALVKSELWRDLADWRRFRAGILLAFLVLGASAVRAFETDQYLALDAEIADSSEAVNAFLNAELELFLAGPKADRLGCRELPPRFYRHLFQGLLASRLQNFLKNAPSIDLFPDDIGYREHLRRSVYRRPSFPYVLPLSPTIRIGEVRFGLDKFGHLFGFGRRYYKHYLRRRARGDSEEEALRTAVRRGLQQERLFVGGWADGVFSYGDLEANFQGMELARALRRSGSAGRADRQPLEGAARDRPSRVRHAILRRVIQQQPLSWTALEESPADPRSRVL